MKRITVSLLLIILVVSSCTKETGPQGPAGTNGTNASTAFQLSFSVPPSSWGNFGTSGTAGCGTLCSLQDANLSFANVGMGAVLVYRQNSIGNLQALSFVEYNTSGTSFQWQYWWEDGNVVIDIFNSLNQYTNVSSSNTFIVVVIPGQKDLPVGVDRKDYNSVIAYYHPRTVH